MTHTALPEMACRELVELVTDYLEHRLSPADRLRFEAHIAACEYCETYLDQMRQTIRILGRLTEEALSREARHALLLHHVLGLDSRTGDCAPCNARPVCGTHE